MIEDAQYDTNEFVGAAVDKYSDYLQIFVDNGGILIFSQEIAKQQNLDFMDARFVTEKTGQCKDDRITNATIINEDGLLNFKEGQNISFQHAHHVMDMGASNFLEIAEITASDCDNILQET